MSTDPRTYRILFTDAAGIGRFEDVKASCEAEAGWIAAQMADSQEAKFEWAEDLA